jgi:hypothetical protein
MANENQFQAPVTIEPDTPASAAPSDDKPAVQYLAESAAFGLGSIFPPGFYSLFDFLFTPEERAQAEADYAKAQAEAQKANPEPELEFTVRFVGPGDPVSDADRESYLKWCEGEKERQALIRKNDERERLAYERECLAYLKRREAMISFDHSEEQAPNEGEPKGWVN